MNDPESGITPDVWSVYMSLPDIGTYFEIFDDFIDFEIRPWDTHGYDKGVMYPERKTALRVLMLARNLNQGNALMYNMLPFISGHAPESVRSTSDEQNKPKMDAFRKKVGIKKVAKDAVLEGFDKTLRQGHAPDAMVERRERKVIGQGKMGEIVRETTTRSVLFDVPGEDSINPQTWDWKAYSSPEDIERQEKMEKAQKAAKRAAARLKKRQHK